MDGFISFLSPDPIPHSLTPFPIPRPAVGLSDEKNEEGEGRGFRYVSYLIVFFGGLTALINPK